MRVLALGCFIWAAIAAPASAQEPQPAFDAQARVSEALAAVRPIAMNRDKVDWVAVEARAREMVATARDTIDLLPAYHLIVWSLGDNHSQIIATDEQVDEWIRRNKRDRYLPDTPRRRRAVSEFTRRSVSGQQLDLPGPGVARLVVVPAFNGDDTDNAFATSITEGLGGTGGECGYVVDLRGNTGGNMFPMVTGLWPLLGEGYGFPAIGGPGLEDGRVILQGGQMTGYAAPDAPPEVFNALPVWPSGRSLSQLPVAVLIDQIVGSSGEGTAIALRDRDNTRFFGEKTYGVASANDVLTLSDGIRLAVTMAYLKDSQSRTYPDGIPPDEPVPTGPGDAADPDDAVVEAAKAWLAGQAACAT